MNPFIKMLHEAKKQQIGTLIVKEEEKPKPKVKPKKAKK